MARIYPRDETSWDIELIEAALREGYGKAYETAEGTMYVIKLEGAGTFAVRPHQISGAFTDSPDEITEVRDAVASQIAAELTADAEQTAALIEEYFSLRDLGKEYRPGEHEEAKRQMISDLTGHPDRQDALRAQIASLRVTPVIPPSDLREGEADLLAHFGL